MFSRRFSSILLSFCSLFFVLALPVSAQLIENYDPTNEYSVRSVAQPEDEDELKSVKYSQVVKEQAIDPVSLLAPPPPSTLDKARSLWQTYVVTPTVTVVRTVADAPIKILSLTNKISDTMVDTAETVYNAASSVIATAKHSAIEYFKSTIAPNITHALKSFFTAVNSVLEKIPIKKISQAVLTRIAIMMSPITGLLSLTEFGQDIISKTLDVVGFVGSSVSDFGIHATIGFGALIGFVYFNKPFVESYEAGKAYVKEVTGRDIGDWRRDVAVTAGVVAVVATIYFAPVIIAGGQSVLTTVTTLGPVGTAQYLSLPTMYALDETGKECSMRPGCGSLLDFGITFGFNFGPLAYSELVAADTMTIAAKNAIFAGIVQKSDDVADVVAGSNKTTNLLADASGVAVTQSVKSMDEIDDAVKIAKQKHPDLDFDLDHVVYGNVNKGDLTKGLHHADTLINYVEKGDLKVSVIKNGTEMFFDSKNIDDLRKSIQNGDDFKYYDIINNKQTTAHVKTLFKENVSPEDLVDFAYQLKNQGSNPIKGNPLLEVTVIHKGQPLTVRGYINSGIVDTIYPRY